VTVKKAREVCVPEVTKTKTKIGKVETKVKEEW